MHGLELPALTLLQLAVILAVIYVVGLLARRVGQPQVVGEMVAGVILGPSLFGWLLPDLHGALFPKASLSVLQMLSQLGLVLYMFLVGTGFSLDLFRRRIRSAAGVSIAGIAGPFVLSSLLTLHLFTNPIFFGAGVSRLEAMLFMGAAMSITAFPVLARIIHERGLSGTSLGTLALAAGAVDDAAAWCIFAVVLANFSGSPTIAIVAVGGGAAYIVLTRLVKRSVLSRLAVMADEKDGLSAAMLSFVLALLLLGAWFTEAVGIHAVFGAFILGAAIPRGVVTRELERMLKPIAASFLVPLFFVYSGLKTQLGLVITPELWGITLLVVSVACLGKGGACWLAARLSGESSREAMALGTLMNARGLMELILLNIALERGIIGPTLFTIMVVMALGTTLMTSPIFEAVYRRSSASRETGDGALAGEARRALEGL